MLRLSGSSTNTANPISPLLSVRPLLDRTAFCGISEELPVETALLAGVTLMPESGGSRTSRVTPSCYHSPVSTAISAAYKIYATSCSTSLGETEMFLFDNRATAADEIKNLGRQIPGYNFPGSILRSFTVLGNLDRCRYFAIDAASGPKQPSARFALLPSPAHCPQPFRAPGAASCRTEATWPRIKRSPHLLHPRPRHPSAAPRVLHPATAPRSSSPKSPLDVIELTDSESDDAPRKRRRTISGASVTVAGPSTITPLRRREQKPSSAARSIPKPFPLARSPSPGPAPRRSSASQHAPEPFPFHNSASVEPAAGVPQTHSATRPAQNRDLVPNGLLGAIPPPAENRQMNLHPPQRTSPEEQLDRYVAQVLEVIPDVSAAHVYGLLEQHRAQFKEQLVDWVVHLLFEDPSYPKADKEKAKAQSVDAPAQEPEVDYVSEGRKKGEGAYVQLALAQLQEDFPDMHQVVAHVLHESRRLYAPAFFLLKRYREEGNVPKKRTPAVRSNGKAKASDELLAQFEKERAWVVRTAQQQRMKLDGELAAQINEEEYEDASGLECGCCFTPSPFDKMIQCPDAHLFCCDCVIAYAGTKLGEHNPNLTCMDTSQCPLRFPDSELRRILPDKLFALYERVRQRREVEAAGLDSLEECPFCDWKAIIEADFEEDKVFRCQNEECIKDHLPKSCEEVEEDKKLDGKHAIEEAMTRALMRNCPRCKKAFIKESGCNKMTCPNCRTLSCYICRQIIDGYEHFDRSDPTRTRAASSSKQQKCILWDPVEARHANEVTEAAKKALEEYKAAHPDVADEDIKVDLPAPVPVAVPAAAQVAHMQPLPNDILLYGQARGLPHVQVYANGPHVPYMMRMRRAACANPAPAPALAPRMGPLAPPAARIAERLRIREEYNRAQMQELMARARVPPPVVPPVVPAPPPRRSARKRKRA
ncbi:hypothetical protein EVG20_g2704 [Dentipellis fragilis]|uniref:RING-type domain-containing protein n=1 Tax=Dentipellis fragilis TaxID=205917 RepID=A0A4Y9Z700_9AGAM|nr:hypothetical protein EVG20_g2704 [Dentipellis fragilis]